MHHLLEPLDTLIAALCENSTCCICIQDVTGEFGGIIDRLPYELKFHLGSVCVLSKNTRRGMGYCAACKFRSIDRARLADRTYVGCCTFGVYEAVRPVYINGRVSCMIFVGNLLHDRALFRERVNRMAPEIGLEPAILLDKEAELCLVKDGDFSPYIRRAELLRSYLLLLAEHSPGLLSRPAMDTQHISNPILRNVLAYTELYYMEPLTVRQLAVNNYVCENYLGRLFKHGMGMTFAQYLNSVRIRAACDLLRNSRDSIASIAVQVGYDSVSYFNRCFRQSIKMTPHEFRALYSGLW